MGRVRSNTWPGSVWWVLVDDAAYYDRKRSQGKKDNAALISLAHRRCDALHAMLRTGSQYQPPSTEPVPAAGQKKQGTR